MMPALRLILLAFAVVLFALAGCNVTQARLHFGWLGMVFLTLALWLH